MSSADIQKAQEALARAQAELANARATRRAETTTTGAGIELERQAFQQFVAAQNDLQRVQQASAGNPPANAVNPAVSPVAAQLEGFVSEEYGIPSNFAETAEPLPPSFEEQLTALLNQSDSIPEPQVTPTYTASPAARQTTISQLDATENALNSLEALPTQERLQVQTQIDALRDQRNRLIAEARAENSVPEPVDDPVVFDEVDEGINNVLNPAPTPEFTDPFTVNVDAGGEVTFTGDPAQDTTVPPQVFRDYYGDDEEDIIDFPTNRIPTDIDDEGYPGGDPFADESFGPVNTATPPDPVPQVNSAALERLKSQAAIRATREPSIGKGDWRYRLQLAPNAPYFYNDPGNSLMAPLRVSDGVIFPYTPRVQVAYQARYTPYEPTHSNYKHYWYQGSHVGEINMDATFTAQDTAEANYLLAVITFLKAASKMFYGQDADRGSPPPVLFLTGLGEYQFNEHPVVISQFNYSLPDDVNYIRANATQINGQAGTLQYRQNLSVNNNNLPSSRIRALINGLPSGAEVTNVNPSGPNLGQNGPTYVPTKININLQLLPVQSRREVSQVFSLQKYASGQLLKGGFW